MPNIMKFLCLLLMIFFFGSCAKEEFVNVLKDKYDATVKEAEFTGEDFIVTLNARALQLGERGEWKIISGTVLENFVFIEDKTNPYSKFKGMPGEEYTLEWKRWATDGTTSVVQVKVKIPNLNIVIVDATVAPFETIRSLSVNPKYRGTWSFDRPYGIIISNYHDGLAEEPIKKPSIELHGYANTNYVATYTYAYAGKMYKFQKEIITGNYTQDEGLYELQMSRGTTRVIEDVQKNIIELNLQASRIAWVFNDITHYPALQAFKKLRKLILGGSSLGQIPTVFGDSYLELEELNMDRMGSKPVFPENFGNLTKLKTLIFEPLSSVDPTSEVLLPSSFGNLKSLEYFKMYNAGVTNFNGTLGKLTNLKTLVTSISRLPEDIGNLKNLQYLELLCKSPSFPQSFSDCNALTFSRMRFNDAETGDVILPTNIGNLKKLETFEITTFKLKALPESFGDLAALKTFRVEYSAISSIPESFGNLSNLETLYLLGTYTKIPNSFGRLGKLKTLTLGTKIEILPESFGDLSSLSYFSADSSELKTLPSSIGRLKNLKEISLMFSKLESLPAEFGALDALEKLNLSTTQLTTFPKAVIPLKAITNILLNNTSTGDIPEDISKMKTGVIFNMANIPNLTLDHLKYIISICRGKVFNTSFGYFATAN